MPTHTHDTPTQDTPAPTQDIQASTHDTTTPTHDTHVPTNVASTSQTRSASTKRKPDMWLGQAKPTNKKPPRGRPKAKPLPANQPTITSVLRSAARREAAPRVIDDPQDELNGCFVFEEDQEDISALLDDISKDPMYLPDEDSEGLIAVAEDDMLEPEVIAALLEDWEGDGSLSGEPATDAAAASPLTSADPPNGPTRVPSTAPEFCDEVSADTAAETAAPGSSRH